MIFAVLATGPSMSQEVADSVRGRCKVIAVSDSWQLAPWADALVSSDAAWWRHKKPDFQGPKYTLGDYPDVEKVKDIPMGTNSGLLGIHIAIAMGGTKVLIAGFDMHGDHFFGRHTGSLKNTPPHRRHQHHKQFLHYRPKGVEILNCTEGSALTCYPMANLEDVLPKTKTTPFNVEDYLTTPEDRAAYEEELTGESENEGMAEPAAPGSGTDNGLYQGAAKSGLRSPTRGHFRAGLGGRVHILEQDQGRG